jgi:GntR family transcriptional regulator/MocR family aminotransferase
LVQAAAGVGRGAPPLVVGVDVNSNVPLFRQVYDGIRAAILAGRLRPGTRLPSTRTLARDVGVSRSTAILAFEHLIAEGYATGRGGAGTFVAPVIPDQRVGRLPPRAVAVTGARPVGRLALRVRDQTIGAPTIGRSPVPFRVGEPALDQFPIKIWDRLLTRRRRAATSFLTYGSPAGFRPLRAAIADYLGASRGVNATADQVILTRGAQQGIDLVARLMLDPGDDVWLEDPGYLAARALFEAAGARLVPVPLDGEGLKVDAGVQKSPHARLAYVAPSHQFPLGVTMSLARRRALLDWAAHAGSWIVEDDYDGEFQYGSRPLSSLQGLDSDARVIYVGTFSKTMFPALRLGYLVVPSDLVDVFTKARIVLDHLAATTTQAALADFITDGDFARHVRRMRALYLERQEALISIVAEELRGVVRALPVEMGMHLVGWLQDRRADDAAVSRQAFDGGIEVPPLSLYCIEDRLPPALLLGFAAVSPRAMQRAARKLGALICL